ncbi:MAG TPA: ADOP family duplicated permease [Gemmatimonadaceae bacterium]|nr:ADOP family duplicated permease [Gemmatimonadaceae bacterium]
MPNLRRISAFHVLVVAMLAVGVGATTAIFSVVNGVLLRPLPFPDPQQLMLVGERAPQIPQSENLQFFDTPSAVLAWREQATDFQGMAALQSTSFTLTEQGQPQVLDGVRVTPTFFDVLEAKPEVGRFFTRADASDSTHPMVITEALWRSAFNADPRVIGRMVGAPGHEARVIGVMPDNFRIGGSELGPMTAGTHSQFFIPFEFGPNSGGDLTAVWSNFNYTVIGRLKPGITVQQALAQLNTIQARLAADAPDKAPGMALEGQITPVLDYATSASRQELWLLLGAVGAVLLIISVNLGGLWVSRMVDRRRDWAIRIALGAEPGRLARQVLREGVTLGLIGGVLGVGCAAAVLHGLLALAPQDIPRLDQAHVDWQVLAMGLLLSAVAGLLTGLVPALRAGRGNPQDSLKGGDRASTTGPASVRSRQGLIGLQAALATLLIAVAGLLGVSLYQLMTKPAGFSTEHAVEARVVLGNYGEAQRDRILQQLPAAVTAIPGVQTAGLTSHLPLQGETWIDGAGVPGKQYTPAQQPSVNVRFIGGDYFRTMRIPLVAGRTFRESDRPAAWPPESRADELKMHEAVIISEATARRIWPGRDARTLIGQPIAFNGLTPTIVGVAADALDGALTSAAPPVVYQPYWNWDPFSFSLVLRTTLPMSAIAGPLRAAVWKLAPNAPIPEIKPLGSLRAAATAPQRYQFTLLMTFAALALLLAAIGVYALVAHSVAQRRKELAIRLALGAPARAIRGLIARQALAPVAAGAVVGLAAALAGGRLLQSLLYGVGTHDPVTLSAAVVVVLLAAVLACVLPARRATRVDPNAALRGD